MTARFVLRLLGICALLGPGPLLAWEKLENCRLAANEYFDGDSFHVAAKGKDRIFRLYAVDTAETNDEFPERVREQEEFFRTTKAVVLECGEQAEELTKRLLQKPFAVETKWIDAKGNSRQQRFFGKITLADGSDLGLRLVEAGLARSYGMRQDLSADYLAELDRAQAAAKRKRLGLWGGGKRGAVLPAEEEEQEAVSSEASEPLDGALGTQSIFDRLQQENAAGVQ